MSDGTLAPLEVPKGLPAMPELSFEAAESREARLSLKIPPLVPGGEPWELRMSDATLAPLEIPKESPIRLAATPLPSPIPTVVAEALAPAAEPTPVATKPYKVLSDEANIHIQSSLGAERMAFTFLPPPPKTQPRA
jgi:hypothetical protein